MNEKEKKEEEKKGVGFFSHTHRTWNILLLDLELYSL